MSGFLFESEAGIGRLTLNRPDRLNALDEPMMAELAERCHQIEQDPEVHVVILTGAGRAFCAGGDIDAWADREPRDFARHWLRDGHRALDMLARLRQPLIAVLNGHALGGGLELAACADYRIAEDHIRIGLPEAGLGIIPGWSGSQRTVRRFGAQVVRRMALFGQVYDAEAALTHGLVDQLAAKGRGLQAALELADSLRHRGAVASELIKMLLNAAEGEERERILEVLAGRIAAAEPELQIGLDAFKSRKKPKFW